MDEPVTKSNEPGYVTFAKTGSPNSRTTQLFINYVTNANLDGMGFAPFAEVEGGASGPGMEVVKKIYDCQERPSQAQIHQRGNAYLDEKFPELTRITSARLVKNDSEEL